jgi:hypothetical protein
MKKETEDRLDDLLNGLQEKKAAQARQATAKETAATEFQKRYGEVRGGVIQPALEEVAQKIRQGGVSALVAVDSQPMGSIELQVDFDGPITAASRTLRFEVDTDRRIILVRSAERMSMIGEAKGSRHYEPDAVSRDLVEEIALKFFQQYAGAR